MTVTLPREPCGKFNAVIGFSQASRRMPLTAGNKMPVRTTTTLPVTACKVAAWACEMPGPCIQASMASTMIPVRICLGLEARSV
ncbi:MAG: hypothetical protein ACK5A0_07550 [Polaromonas sp.]